MTNQTSDISVVIPTYNRANALRVSLSYALALEDVREIIVVVDGSTDDTDSVLHGVDDARVRVLTHAHRQGSQVARKTGRSAAQGEWILMLDDDCAGLSDFARILLDTARRCNADVVAAPWIHEDTGAVTTAALSSARKLTSPRIGLDTSPSVFPSRDFETPFLPGNAVLINRRVFEQVAYDESLTGNAWREETNFYLDARAAGFRCVLTPRTASFQVGDWDGGQRLPWFRYEWYALNNNWRFLRRHGNDLRARGEIRGPVRAQLGFAVGRALAVGKGHLRARFKMN